MSKPPVTLTLPHRMMLGVFTALLWSGAAGAQPGDAAFCRQYAETVAIAAEDAMAMASACHDPWNGVHASRSRHEAWCARTPQSEVEGAAVHIRRLASRCTNGALAVPTEYGGYDIVGHERFERPYGRARDWDVRAAFSGRSFLYCVAVRTGAEGPVRLGVDLAMPGEGSQWQLAVPLASRPDWRGALRLDGGAAIAGRSAEVGGTAVGEWTVAWLGLAELEGLRDGRTATLDLGSRALRIGLDGMAAAVLKLEECRTRRGRAA